MQRVFAVKNIARNVCYPLHAAGIVFQLSFFLFM